MNERQPTETAGYLRVLGDDAIPPTQWKTEDDRILANEKIRAAFQEGGWPAAVKVAADLAIADLKASALQAAAVRDYVTAEIERDNPQAKKQRVREELQRMGLGRKR